MREHASYYTENEPSCFLLLVGVIVMVVVVMLVVAVVVDAVDTAFLAASAAVVPTVAAAVVVVFVSVCSYTCFVYFIFLSPDVTPSGCWVQSTI